MVAKWLSRSAFLLGTLYFASRVLGADIDAGMLGCQGGLWNDYGACEQGYNATLLFACQRHRMVAYFSSKNDT